MRNQPVPLVTGFYADQDRPFSQQDVWNYLPCRAEKQGTRSPLMLKTPPGLYPWLELEGAPPVRGIHDCEGRLFAVIGSTLYRLSPKGVAIPIGTIPGNGRVSMDHNQRANGQQLTVVNGSAGYVFDTHTEVFERITDSGFPGSPIVRFMDGYMLGLDPAGRFAFSSGAANALDYNTLDRWTSEYRPDRLVSMARLGGELLLLSANSGEFFGNTGAAQQPFRSKRIFLDKGCAGPHTVVEADNTVFWLGSDGYFYQLDGYNSRRISTRPIEQAIRGQDWWNAFAFVWESEGHTVVYWTFLNGQTWGWDTSQQEWHRRESYGLSRWRPSCTARSGNAWYAGDFQKGRIWRLDWGYPWEGDTEFVSGFTLPVIHDNQNELVHSRLELVMDVGAPAIDPRTFPEQPSGPFISGAAPDGFVGLPYAYEYSVTAGDSPTLAVGLLEGEAPPGLSFSDGSWSGEPSVVGTYPVTIKVTDGNGLYATLQDSIDIAAPFIVVGTYTNGSAFYTLRVTDLDDWTGDLVGTVGAAWGVSLPGRVLVGNHLNIWKSTDLGASWSQTEASLSGAGGPRTAAYRDGALVLAGGIDGYYRSGDGGESVTLVSTPRIQFVGWAGERLIAASQYANAFSYSDSTPGQFNSGTETFSTGANHNVSLSYGGSCFAFGGCFMLGGRDASTSKPKLAITENGTTVRNVTISEAANGEVTAIAAATVGNREVWIACTGAGEVFFSDDRFVTRTQADYTAPDRIDAAGYNGRHFLIGGGTLDTGFAAYSADGAHFAAVSSTPFDDGIRLLIAMVAA